MISHCVSLFDCAQDNVLKCTHIHRQGRKSSSDRDMRYQYRPLSLDLSFLSLLEPTQGEDLGFNVTKSTSLPLLTHSSDVIFLHQKQAEYLETTKDVGNQRLDFRFAY
jgi:hypothetical protein